MKMLLVVLLVVLGSNRLPGKYDGQRRARPVNVSGGNGGSGPPEGP